MSKKFTRRRFVKTISVLPAGLLLAACGDPTATSIPGLPRTAAPTTAAVPAKAEWGYEGAEGPEKWGTLDTAYAVCSSGKTQSPIDIAGSFQPSPLKVIKPAYSASATHLENNGHTIQFNYDKGSVLNVDEKQYDLVQFHFHSPSEHKIGGKSYPLEIHLVHQAADKSLAVIGILFEEGADNPLLAQFWDKLPAAKGEKANAATSINIKDELPTAKNYFTYEGSLTTPSCSESVRWIVMKNPIVASKAQVEKFKQATGGHSTARPVQPLNGRIIGEGTLV